MLNLGTWTQGTLPNSSGQATPSSSKSYWREAWFQGTTPIGLSGEGGGRGCPILLGGRWAVQLLGGRQAVWLKIDRFLLRGISWAAYLWARKTGQAEGAVSFQEGPLLSPPRRCAEQEDWWPRDSELDFQKEVCRKAPAQRRWEASKSPRWTAKERQGKEKVGSGTFQEPGRGPGGFSEF